MTTLQVNYIPQFELCGVEVQKYTKNYCRLKSSPLHKIKTKTIWKTRITCITIHHNMSEPF